MNIRMPKINGVDATRAVRAWEDQHGLSRTPILALTANLDDSTMSLATWPPEWTA